MKQRPTALGFKSRDQRAYIENRFKIYSPDNGQSYEMYDLIADPRESNNIVQQHPKEKAAMVAQLDKWIRSCENSEKGGDYISH